MTAAGSSRSSWFDPMDPAQQAEYEAERTIIDAEEAALAGRPESDQQFLDRLVVQRNIVAEALARKQKGLPCWCGHPLNAHAGWLVCATKNASQEGTR